MRQLVTCYVPFCIYLESHRIDIATIANRASNRTVQQAARSARGRGELRDCGYLLRDRGASLALNAAYSVKTLAAVPNPDVVSAKSARERRFGNSKKRSKNRPLPKVIPYATRSSLRVTNSSTEPVTNRNL